MEPIRPTENIKRNLNFIVTCFLIIFISICIVSCSNLLEQNHNSINQNAVSQIDKLKGTHVFGSVDLSNIQIFKENNIEWVALVPWGFQENHQSAEVKYHRGDSLQIKKRDSSWIKQINLAQEAGYKVFFKPHIWITDNSNGKWRSDILPTNEENLETWKNSYRDFILRCAMIAETAEAELFCVGMEFTELTEKYPQFWRSIIKEVKSKYSGEITYAANWYKEYENINFWDQLDYIGIQAYFPLTKNDSPSTEEISDGWNHYMAKLESLAKKHKKKMIFTEMGYKSSTDSAKEPWTWIDYSDQTKEKLCFATQANCYQAFFNTVWPKEWLAGLFIWQMRGDHRPETSENNADFTPQSKPAEKIIKQGYSSL